MRRSKNPKPKWMLYMEGPHMRHVATDPLPFTTLAFAAWMGWDCLLVARICSLGFILSCIASGEAAMA